MAFNWKLLHKYRRSCMLPDGRKESNIKRKKLSVKQRNAEVSDRLCVSTHILYKWLRLSNLIIANSIGGIYWKLKARS